MENDLPMDISSASLSTQASAQDSGESLADGVKTQQQERSPCEVHGDVVSEGAVRRPTADVGLQVSLSDLLVAEELDIDSDLEEYDPEVEWELETNDSGCGCDECEVGNILGRNYCPNCGRPLKLDENNL